MLAVLLTSGCSAGDDSRGAPVELPPNTIVVGDRTMDVARLTEAVDGLCQARREAATDPAMARSTYDRRSRVTIDEIFQILQPSYAILAGSLSTTAERVVSDAATGPEKSSLADDLGHLAAFTRQGLAQLGITTAACPS